MPELNPAGCMCFVFIVLAIGAFANAPGTVALVALVIVGIVTLALYPRWFILLLFVGGFIAVHLDYVSLDSVYNPDHNSYMTSARYEIPKDVVDSVAVIGSKTASASTDVARRLEQSLFERIRSRAWFSPETSVAEPKPVAVIIPTVNVTTTPATAQTTNATVTTTETTTTVTEPTEEVLRDIIASVLRNTHADTQLSQKEEPKTATPVHRQGDGRKTHVVPVTPPPSEPKTRKAQAQEAQAQTQTQEAEIE